jgi:hypothetical protein
MIARGDRERLVTYQKKLQDADMEKWLETTGRFPETKWRLKEKRSLRIWFDKLDQDHSGEIDVKELADPMLSAGLVNSMTEVKRLLRSVDEDQSNGIGFDEFLDVMKSKKELGRKKEHHCGLAITKQMTGTSRRINKPGEWNNIIKQNKYGIKKVKKTGEPKVNPLVQLTERERVNNINADSSLCCERRKLLLDATMGEAQRRQRTFDKVCRWRGEMKRMTGVAKFKKLKDITQLVQQMEVNHAEKENIISVMKDVLSKALESDKEFEIVQRTKTDAEKESIRKRNVMMLTEDTTQFRRAGGRLAVAYPRTRMKSIPTILGIPRKHTSQ